jgi:2-oxoglutarate dehydrogenase E1 component
MGAWSFAQPEVEAVLQELAGKTLRLRYVGRPAAAAPATGLLRRHLKEQAALIDAALNLAS